MDWEDELGNRPDPLTPWAPLAAVGVRRGSIVELDAVEPRVFIGSSGGFVTGPEVVMISQSPRPLLACDDELDDRSDMRRGWRRPDGVESLTDSAIRTRRPVVLFR